MSRIGAKKLRQTRELAQPAPIRADVTKTFSPAPRISTWAPTNYRGEITWPQIDAIQQNAERGYVEQWADLTRRMLKSDDHLLSTYITYVGAIAGSRREVRPQKVPAQYAEIAARQAADCEAMLDALPNLERSLGQLIDADFTGYAAQEIIWEARGDVLQPVGLEWIHPDRFRFSDTFELYLWDRGLSAERAKQLGLDFAGSSVDGLGLPLPRNKYVVHVPQLIPDYPTSSGIFYACVRPWFVKSWATKFWLSGAEVAGNPRMLGKLPEMAPDVVREELYAALSAMSADGVGIVSGGTDIAILDPRQQGTGGVWETLLKRQDAAISKAVLGSTLNVEVGDAGGNRSLGESQADMTIAPRWNRSSVLLANTIKNALLKPFLEFNRHLYGGHVFVPNLILHITEDEPAVDDLAVNSGVVSKDELRRSRKLEPWGPERGGDDLIPAAQPMAPAFTASQRTAAAARPPVGLSAGGAWSPNVGDRVRVKSGAAHDDMTKDAEGEIAEVSAESALAIRFDGMDELHRWYVASELDRVSGTAAEGADAAAPLALSQGQWARVFRASMESQAQAMIQTSTRTISRSKLAANRKR
jgi:phage gp29-like protein